MHTPASTMSTQGFTWSTSEAGKANMAMPTPNQPIWVRLMRKEGR